MKIAAIVIGSIIGVAGVTTTANAYEYYSAAGCGFGTAAQGTIYKAGVASNKGNAVNLATCPIALNSSYTRRYYYLTVNRAPGSAPMTCYLTSRSGSSVTTTTQPVSTTGSSQNLYFSSSTSYPSAESLGCNLPGKVSGGESQIWNYQVYQY